MHTSSGAVVWLVASDLDMTSEESFITALTARCNVKEGQGGIR